MRKRITYRVAHGAKIKAKDAQLLGQEIQAIASRDQTATPEKLVEAARKTTSTIHHLFDWNDKTASTKWRLQQASYYIRSITIIITTPKESIETRAFQVVTRETGERGAVAAREVFATRTLADQVISSALEELRSWQHRYAQYRKCAELCDVFDVIEKITKPRKLKKTGG